MRALATLVILLYGAIAWPASGMAGSSDPAGMTERLAVEDAGSDDFEDFEGEWLAATVASFRTAVTGFASCAQERPSPLARKRATFCRGPPRA